MDARVEDRRAKNEMMVVITVRASGQDGTQLYALSLYGLTIKLDNPCLAYPPDGSSSGYSYKFEFHVTSDIFLVLHVQDQQNCEYIYIEHRHL